MSAVAVVPKVDPLAASVQEAEEAALAEEEALASVSAYADGGGAGTARPDGRMRIIELGETPPSSATPAGASKSTALAVREPAAEALSVAPSIGEEDWGLILGGKVYADLDESALAGEKDEAALIARADTNSLREMGAGMAWGVGGALSIVAMMVGVCLAGGIPLALLVGSFLLVTIAARSGDRIGSIRSMVDQEQRLRDAKTEVTIENMKGLAQDLSPYHLSLWRRNLVEAARRLNLPDADKAHVTIDQFREMLRTGQGARDQQGRMVYDLVSMMGLDSLALFAPHVKASPRGVLALQEMERMGNPLAGDMVFAGDLEIEWSGAALDLPETADAVLWLAERENQHVVDWVDDWARTDERARKIQDRLESARRSGGRFE